MWEIIEIRDRAPRHETRCLFSISILNADAQPSFTLVGHTRDISLTGLSLIVPAIRLGYHRLTDEDCLLKILMEPLIKQIEIQAVPKRYVRFETNDKDLGYLVGVAITQMTANARADYLKYIYSLEKQKRRQK